MRKLISLFEMVCPSKTVAEAVIEHATSKGWEFDPIKAACTDEKCVAFCREDTRMYYGADPNRAIGEKCKYGYVKVSMDDGFEQIDTLESSIAIYGHTVKFSADGITVGCQKVELDTIRAINKRFRNMGVEV